MSQIEMIRQIFYDFERMNGKYVNFPEADEARENLENYLTKTYLSTNDEIAKNQWLDMEPFISDTVAEYEKQGFVYGFQYAVALLITGRETAFH